MSIINKNTLVGFHNKFADDADESIIVHRDSHKNDQIQFYIVDEDDAEIQERIHILTNPEQETFLPIEKISQSSIANNDVEWKKYNPTKLQEPISPATYSTTLKKDETKENLPEYAKSTSTSRRRPTTVVKSLTSSDVSKKYDLLLDKRLMLLQGQLNHMEQENALIIRKRKLEIEVLETE
ncbi:unnamed protein product [Ceutorhynchus assimilis]|uniref:Uncharacterized protein n=1 Tax=Ceutorhynchus assimilis TaxID=467358 RepID=A0A9N9M9H7_9CUCU|nr:unnamed protein product [Ceutorhynchus assimilis]